MVIRQISTAVSTRTPPHTTVVMYRCRCVLYPHLLEAVLCTPEYYASRYSCGTCTLSAPGYITASGGVRRYFALHLYMCTWVYNKSSIISGMHLQYLLCCSLYCSIFDDNFNTAHSVVLSLSMIVAVKKCRIEHHSKLFDFRFDALCLHTQKPKKYYY